MDYVWIGPREHGNGQLLDISSPITYRTPKLSWADVIDNDRYSPDMDHAWVQGILNDMPVFRPTIMFRLCMDKPKESNRCFCDLDWKKRDIPGDASEEQEFSNDAEA